MQDYSKKLKELNLPLEVRRALEKLLEELPRALGEAEAYLFGSYARGDWLKDSDVDLIIVSPAFQGKELGERYRMVRGLLPPTLSIELLLYTPEEFEKARRKSIILQDAASYWVKLL